LADRAGRQRRVRKRGAGVRVTVEERGKKELVARGATKRTVTVKVLNKEGGYWSGGSEQRAEPQSWVKETHGIAHCCEKLTEEFKREIRVFQGGKVSQGQH